MTASQKKKRVRFILPPSESDGSEASDESDSESGGKRLTKSPEILKRKVPLQQVKKEPPQGSPSPSKSILKKTKPVYQQVVQPSFLPLSVINSVINSVGAAFLSTPESDSETNVFEEDFKEKSYKLSLLKEETEEDKENDPSETPKFPIEPLSAVPIEVKATTPSQTFVEDTLIDNSDKSKEIKVTCEESQEVKNHSVKDPITSDLKNNKNSDTATDIQGQREVNSESKDKSFCADRLKNIGLFSPVLSRKNNNSKINDRNSLTKNSSDPSNNHQLINLVKNNKKETSNSTNNAKLSVNSQKLLDHTNKNSIPQKESASKRELEPKGPKESLKSSEPSNNKLVSNLPGSPPLPNNLKENKRPLFVINKAQRKPFKMPQSANADPGNLNCAGEPDSITPAMRDDIKEKDLLIWIYNMIDEPARVDFEFFLKDGCILCRLMNRIKPGCIPEEDITWEGARSKQKNIKMFLENAEKYGVPKAKLFHVEDLLHLRHIPRVTRCIYALAKLAQDDAGVEDCSRLGDEPNFVTAVKKEYVPGHRDTKDVMNQLESSLQKKEEKKEGGKHSLYK